MSPCSGPHHGSLQVQVPHSPTSSLPATTQPNLSPYTLPSQWHIMVTAEKGPRHRFSLSYFLVSDSGSGDVYPAGGLKASGRHLVQCSSHRRSGSAKTVATPVLNSGSAQDSSFRKQQSRFSVQDCKAGLDCIPGG